METIIHRSGSRGYNDNGWLQSYYSFCYANFYDPRRINFGVLRVLNDNIIDGGEGLRSMPHDNMEMLIIPLEGCLEHTDNLGNHTTIEVGEAQIISAGKGLVHREYNHNLEKNVKYLHLWIFPREYELDPIYSKVTLAPQPENGLLPVATPEGDENTLKIYQNAWIYKGQLSQGNNLKYTLKQDNHSLYIMILEGNATIAETILNRRDAIGLVNLNNCEITANEDLQFLLVEIPMNRE